MNIETKTKLEYLSETKAAIKSAIVAKGQPVSDSDTFRSYAEKIGNIQGGGAANPVLESLEVTENGSYTPGEGVDGYSSVKVNVPDIPAVVQPLEVTENGTYNVPEGVDGFDQVIVNIDSCRVNIFAKRVVDGFVQEPTFGAFSPGAVTPPEFVLEVDKTYIVYWDGNEYECKANTFSMSGMSLVVIGNGATIGLPSNNEPFLLTYNETLNDSCIFSLETVSSHEVAIWEKVAQELVLQDKTITENGEYTADAGFDALGKVIVDVTGSGGGNGNLVVETILPEQSFTTVSSNNDGCAVVKLISKVTNIDRNHAFIIYYDGEPWLTGIFGLFGTFGAMSALIEGFGNHLIRKKYYTYTINWSISISDPHPFYIDFAGNTLTLYTEEAGTHTVRIDKVSLAT